MLKLSEPVAITMWDFSWLERRWPGAGYEDWARALDELAERGYNAVRIDAYPHLIEWGAEKTWELLPTWHFLDWGAAMRCNVRVLPELLEFLSLCQDRKIKAGLSTWFREDVNNVRMNISSPEVHGRIWVTTLEAVRRAGLLDTVLYVDLCNEWPGDRWAPFFKNDPATPEFVWNAQTAKSRNWCMAASQVVKVEALAMLHLRKPSLLVLDVNMPERDGLTVLKTIKEHEELKDVRIAMYSSDTHPETMAEALRLGALEFLVKGTIGLDALVAKICELAGEPA